jgi:hypothetical protein
MTGAIGQRAERSIEPLLAGFLFALAGWSLFIKYLFPIAWSIAYGEALTEHIYWDAWPLAHAILAWALLAQPSGTRMLAITMAIAEITIVVISLTWFLDDPDWTIWRTNWFVNKIFVLLCFASILAVALSAVGRGWGGTMEQ